MSKFGVTTGLQKRLYRRSEATVVTYFETPDKTMLLRDDGVLVARAP